MLDVTVAPIPPSMNQGDRPSSGRQRKTGISPEAGIVTVPEPPNDCAEFAAPDPEIPAEDEQTTWWSRLSRSRREVQGHVRAHITAPVFQTLALVIFMAGQAKFIGV